MTNHLKPASEPNATQILKKFILKHLRPKKSTVSEKKVSIGYDESLGVLSSTVVMRPTALMRPNKKY